MLSLLLGLGCPLLSGDPPAEVGEPAPSPPRFRLVDGSGVSLAGKALAELPFDLLAADLDLDGDDELLLNRHLNGLWLLESVDGQLRSMDRKDRRSGIQVPPGVRQLFGHKGLLDQQAEPGVLLYQVYGKGAQLDVQIRSPDQKTSITSLNIKLSEPFEVEGEPAVERISDRELRLPLPPPGASARLRLRCKDNTPRLDLVQEDAGGRPVAAPLPWFVGGNLDRFEGASLRFWVSDPHGMVVAPLTGGRRPDLFVARGGNAGRSQARGEEKEHDLYLAQPEGPASFRFEPQRVPPDSGRARGAELVDLDNDGKVEVFVANRDGPPALLVWLPLEQRFEDRHLAHGLQGLCSEVGAWLDTDEDGWEDLVLLCEGGLDIWRNQGVGALVREPGLRLELALGGPAGSAHGWLREEAIQVLDANGDDRLDLWLCGVGPRQQQRLLLGQSGGGFLDATDALGLASAEGIRECRSMDADRDGWPDLFTGGSSARLYWNRAGQGFQAVELAALIENGEALDPARARLLPFVAAPEDRRESLLLSGSTWAVARPATEGEATLLRLRLEPSAGRGPPVGALVRAVYRDGHTQRQRHGSQARSSLSQSLGELRFGLPRPDAIERVEVRWPGQGEWQAVPVDPSLPVQRLEAPR